MLLFCSDELIPILAEAAVPRLLGDVLFIGNKTLGVVEIAENGLGQCAHDFLIDTSG